MTTLPEFENPDALAATGNPRAVKICVVAGEASGDAHSALVVASLRKLFPNATFFGMGGSKLRAEGVQIIVDSESAGSHMGLTELFGNFRTIIQSFKTIEAECKKEKPDLVILVDYPDFNLRLAKKLKKNGSKILYFISPQLWAWRSGRVKTIRKYVDAVAAIFPFEERFYHENGVRAEYVGHPFLDEPFPDTTRQEFCASIGVDPARPIIAMLPGSRKSEIERLLPYMIAGFERVRQSRPGVQGLIPLAPGLSVNLIKPLLPADKTDLVLVDGRARELLKVADLAVVASGTATVEAALAEVPFFVVYRLSNLTYRIARFLVRGIQYFAMPNLIAGKKVVEELLQDEVTPERIQEEMERLLGDKSARDSVRAALKKVAERLRTGEKASEKTAMLARALILGEGETTGPRWRRGKKVA